MIFYLLTLNFVVSLNFSKSKLKKKLTSFNSKIMKNKLRIFVLTIYFLLFFRFINNPYFCKKICLLLFLFSIFNKQNRKFIFLLILYFVYLYIFIAIMPKIVLAEKQDNKTNIIFEEEEMVVIQLPGNVCYLPKSSEKNVVYINESSCICSFNELIKNYVNQIEKALKLNEENEFSKGKRKIRFHGHSMGGVMVLAIANKLKEKYPKLKINLIVENTFTDLACVLNYAIGMPVFLSKILLALTFGNVSGTQLLKKAQDLKIETFVFHASTDNVLGENNKLKGKENNFNEPFCGHDYIIYMNVFAIRCFFLTTSSA